MLNLPQQPFDMRAFEDELLTIVVEECSEVTKQVCKGKRFGLDDVTTLPNGNSCPRDRLSLECGQLVHVIELMLEYEMIDRGLFLQAHDVHRDCLRTFMRHHPEEPVGGADGA